MKYFELISLIFGIIGLTVIWALVIIHSLILLHKDL